MSKAFLFATFLAGAASASSQVNEMELFQNFMRDFGKTYASKEEEKKRFEIFLDNLALIEERNARDTAVHGITKFADLTPQEFSDHYTNYVPSSLFGARAGKYNKFDYMYEMIDVEISDHYESNNTLVDWTNIYTTPGRLLFKPCRLNEMFSFFALFLSFFFFVC
jgi:hypothetical protein